MKVVIEIKKSKSINYIIFREGKKYKLKIKKIYHLLTKVGRNLKIEIRNLKEDGGKLCCIIIFEKWF